MSIKLWRIAGPVLGVTLMTGICAAHDTPKPEKPLSERVSGAAENLKAGAFRAEEQVGEKVGGAVDSLKKSAKNAGNAIRDQYEKARTSVHNMGVSARVYGRLHWDKALTNSKPEVDVRQDGVATLTGTVVDALARAKAVELTKDTVGVTTVVDNLVVQTTSTTVAPARTVPPKP